LANELRKRREAASALVKRLGVLGKEKKKKTKPVVEPNAPAETQGKGEGSRGESGKKRGGVMDKISGFAELKKEGGEVASRGGAFK